MNKYLSILQPAIDKFDLIAETTGDGGDSAQREGSLLVYAYCALQEGKITQAEFDEIQDRYLANYKRLREKCMPGEIRRHVDESMWYGENLRMTRDQWTPNVVAIGIIKNNLKVKLDMLLGMALRGFLFTTSFYKNHEPKSRSSFKSPDLTVLSSWSYVLRWFGWAFFPLIALFDIDLLIGSLIWKYRISKPDNTNTDILNHVISLLQAKYKCPTPISWLARKVLKPEEVLKLLHGYHHAQGPRMDLVAEDFLKESWK